MNPTTRQQIVSRALRAFHVSQFVVRIIRLDGTPHATRTFTREHFINSLGWMASCSKDREHVFFRPDGVLRWVLVDDISETGLQWMRDDGVHPGVVVQTNPHTPDNLQAWICLGRTDAVSDKEASIAARILASRYGGDIGASSHSQLGRVIGTYNAKPQHWRDDRQPPLVKLRFADTAGVRFATELLEEARQQAEAEAQTKTPQSAQAGACHTDDIRTSTATFDAEDDALLADLFDATVKRFNGDRSKADVSVAALMRDAGDSPQQVFNAVMKHSGKAQERQQQQRAGSGLRYAEHVVRTVFDDDTHDNAGTEHARSDDHHDNDHPSSEKEQRR